MPPYRTNKGPVSGELHWVDGKPDTDCPVSFGIPFAKGELKAGKTVVLKDPTGNIIPADCWTMACWPDGSVKWAGLATVAKADAETLHFETVNRKEAHKPMAAYENIHVAEQPTHYVVSTGKIEAYIPKSGHCLLDSLCMNGRRIGGAAELCCTTQNSLAAEEGKTIHFTDYKGELERVTVERTGTIRALLRLDGHYTDGKGREWLPFTVRLYFYAGSEQVRMVHTFVFNGDAEKDFIRSLGIPLRSPHARSGLQPPCGFCHGRRRSMGRTRTAPFGTTYPDAERRQDLARKTDAG